MRFLYTGFNMYRQITSAPRSIIELFQEFHYPEAYRFNLAFSFLLITDFEQNFIFEGSSKPVHLPELLKDIVHVTCSHNRCLFLTSSGNILKWEISNSQIISTVSLMLTCDDKIINLSCGPLMSVAVSHKGKIFNIPNLLRCSIVNVIDVVVGNEHCIILDSTGSVFTFGGGRGQLGHGNINDELEPKLVKALIGKKILKIAAGGWHSCAVSTEGILYCWGWNSNGQLGVSKNSKYQVIATPRKINFQENKVIQIACGSRHTIALLGNNHLFGCGWNKYYQLGISSKNENIFKMTKLIALDLYDEMKLICGPWSTALVIP